MDAQSSNDTRTQEGEELAAREMRGEAATLDPGEKLSVFLRSFLIQAAWNTRDMQNIGFCYSILPVLRRLQGDRPRIRAFLTRHLAFFNTNPALATYVISAAARAEAEGSPDKAVELKRVLSGPLGMAGDALLWGALRPLAALTGVVAVLAGARWAPLLLLLVYNVPHLWLRARGAAGRGTREVLGPGLRALTAAARSALSFAAGLTVALALKTEPASPQTLVVAGIFFILTLLALRTRVPITAIGLAGVAGGVAIMYTRF